MYVVYLFFKSNIHLQGDQPWLDNGHYWDDFFLLKVNAKYLLEELERTYIEKPAVLKPQLNAVFDQCLLFVNSTHRIRQLNAYYVRNGVYIYFSYYCVFLDSLYSYTCSKSS